MEARPPLSAESHSRRECPHLCSGYNPLKWLLSSRTDENMRVDTRAKTLSLKSTHRRMMPQDATSQKQNALFQTNVPAANLWAMELKQTHHSPEIKWCQGKASEKQREVTMNLYWNSCKYQKFRNPRPVDECTHCGVDLVNQSVETNQGLPSTEVHLF